jgi:prepilin-type N-terminal cleavage/methylation domain-containing protein
VISRIQNAARRRAFTLIELLVVISIIALLVSLALPALTQARGAAQLSVCKSNIRQIYLATATYNLENKRLNINYSGAGGEGPGWWQYRLFPYLGADLTGIQEGLQNSYGCQDDIEQKISWGRLKVLQCPSNSSLNRPSTIAGTTYAVPGHTYRWNSYGQVLIRMSEDPFNPGSSLEFNWPLEAYWKNNYGLGPKTQFGGTSYPIYGEMIWGGGYIWDPYGLYGSNRYVQFHANQNTFATDDGRIFSINLPGSDPFAWIPLVQREQ